VLVVNPDQNCAKNGAVTKGEKQQIYQTLHKLPQVVHVSFQSQAQAFQQAKQLFANEPVMLDFVQPGDLPASYIVKMKNAQADAVPVTEAVLGQPGVDSVGDDAAILTKFYALLDGARNAVIVVAIILIIAAILLVANTIRLSAFNRRRETSIMRLVGASNFYVQLPFLLEGIIAGMFGWLIAAGLLIAVKTLGLDTLQQYFPYNVRLSLADLIEVIVLAMVMGVVLCGVTSFLTLRRYLRA
jgi:cell division transport system permease protein